MTATDNWRGQRRTRHEALAEALRREIGTGRWDVGARMPRACPAAIRGVDRHPAGIRNLCDLTMGSCCPPGPPTLGVLIPSTEYYGHTVDGIDDAVSPHGIRMVLACSQHDVDRELMMMRTMVRDGVDALIVAPSRCERDDDPLWRELLAEISVPTVFVERIPPKSGRHRISHVAWRNGHRNVWVNQGSTAADGQQRVVAGPQ